MFFSPSLLPKISDTAVMITEIMRDVTTPVRIKCTEFPRDAAKEVKRAVSATIPVLAALTKEAGSLL